MTDEAKKPKIDIKSRLSRPGGSTLVGGSGFPAPTSGSGFPPAAGQPFGGQRPSFAPPVPAAPASFGFGPPGTPDPSFAPPPAASVPPAMPGADPFGAAPAAAPPADPFAAPAAPAGNPFGGAASADPFAAPAAPAGNPFGGAASADPFAAPAAPAGNPFGAPASADPFAAPAAPAGNPFGAPASADPFAAQAPVVAPAPVAAAPVALEAPSAFGAAQTFKIEVSEELENEKKKFVKKTILACGVAAVLAGAMGFAWGGAAKTGEATKRARNGAVELEKAVKTASEKLAELKAKVDGGMTSLTKKEYPDALSKELGGLTIPFDASYLENKGVGNFNGPLQKKVFAFAQGVTQVNERKEELARVLGGAKAPIEKFWKDTAEKTVNLAVVFRNQEGKGVVAELVPNKSPFGLEGAWVDSFNVLRAEKGSKPAEKPASRWKKGDLVPKEGLVAVPVDPDTVGGLAGENVAPARLGQAMREMHFMLDGRHDDPTRDTAGLIKDAEQVIAELKKIGGG